MPPARAELAIAVLAKAPLPGLAKTRLIPALGADGAAALQARLIARTVGAALEVAPVTLWATPDTQHAVFRALSARVRVRTQPDGDLGARMLAAVGAAPGPVLVVGTDCPALDAARLRDAADALCNGVDVVVMPVEDGGYALIGMHAPHPELFEAMTWSDQRVMAQTRRRLARAGLAWRELARLWDVDTPADLERLRREYPELL